MGDARGKATPYKSGIRHCAEQEEEETGKEHELSSTILLNNHMPIREHIISRDNCSLTFFFLYIVNLSTNAYIIAALAVLSQGTFIDL